MDADLNRLFVGIAIIFFVAVCYIFKFDFFLIIFISFFCFYEFFKLKIFNIFLQIVVISLTLILLGLKDTITILWNNLYVIQLILIFSILFINKYKFILFYISIFIFCLLLFSINYIDRSIFYLIIFISFFNDTVAYIFGSKIKGPLIIPNISPNKTWSGTLISFTLSASILYFFKINLLLSAIISASLFFGDIFFSFIKRTLNLNDFSSSLGRHGGILDRLDSMYFTTIIFYFYISLNI